MNSTIQPDEPARQLTEVIIVQHDEANHTACLDALDAYVAAQIDGQDYSARFPSVSLHLDSCVACAEAYAALYEARLTEGRLPLPVVVPVPDLSFLKDSSPASSLQQAERLQQLLKGTVQRVGGRLRVVLSQPLFDLLPLAMAPALRSGSGSSAVLLDLRLEPPDDIVTQLQITAYRNPGSLDWCAVHVGVGLRDRDWPDLAGISVTLVMGEDHRNVLTDAWGHAIFEQIPIGLLSFLQIEVNDSAAPPITT